MEPNSPRRGTFSVKAHEVNCEPWSESGLRVETKARLAMQSLEWSSTMLSTSKTASLPVRPAPSTSTPRWSAWRRRPTVTGAGRSPPTGASSATATPASTGRLAALTQRHWWRGMARLISHRRGVALHNTRAAGIRVRTPGTATSASAKSRLLHGGRPGFTRPAEQLHRGPAAPDRPEPSG